MVDTFVNLLKRTDCLAIDESIKIYKKIENEVGDAITKQSMAVWISVMFFAISRQDIESI